VVAAQLRQHLALDSGDVITGADVRLLQQRAVASNSAAAARALASLARLLRDMPALAIPAHVGHQVLCGNWRLT